jgi:hypothetical protein
MLVVAWPVSIGRFHGLWAGGSVRVARSADLVDLGPRRPRRAPPTLRRGAAPAEGRAAPGLPSEKPPFPEASVFWPAAGPEGRRAAPMDAQNSTCQNERPPDSG